MRESPVDREKAGFGMMKETPINGIPELFPVGPSGGQITAHGLMAIKLDDPDDLDEGRHKKPATSHTCTRWFM
jgi:hypothetical protein